MGEQAIVTVRPWCEFSALRAVLGACLRDMGGITRFVRPGQTVVIKPNLTANAPETSGGTTHVDLVAAIVEAVRTAFPSRIIVAEGTGAFGVRHETAFPTGGWREMAKRLGVTLYNLDAGPHDEVCIPNGRYPSALPFSRLVRECDVFISVPCLKTHITTDYTVALKNSFALTPQWKRTEIHREYQVEASLVDLNRIRKPDLIIVDGWDGAEGIAGGTDFERPARARLMLAGDDPVAVDVIAREVMGLGRQRTRYLAWAIEDGLGIGDRARILLRGSPLEEVRRHFMTPAEELEILLPGLTLCDLDACSGCRIAALAAVSRFRYQRLLKPLRLVYGGEGEIGNVAVDTIFVGNCAARRAAGQPGQIVPGCPASVPEIIEAIEGTGCICQKCRALVYETLAQIPSEALAWVRVSAAGTEIWQGEKVDRAQAHVELVVGDCMPRYVRILRERAAQFGMDAENDVIWVRGCPPESSSLQEGIRRAVERATRVFAGTA